MNVSAWAIFFSSIAYFCFPEPLSFWCTTFSWHVIRNMFSFIHSISEYLYLQVFKDSPNYPLLPVHCNFSHSQNSCPQCLLYIFLLFCVPNTATVWLLKNFFMLIICVSDHFLLKVSLHSSWPKQCLEVGKHDHKMKGENWGINSKEAMQKQTCLLVLNKCLYKPEVSHESIL